MVPALVAKDLRDRWVGVTIAVASVAGLLLFAMAAYRDIDLSVYTDLPEGLRSLMGIPEGADVASLSYNVMLGFIAALTLAGVAVSMGSASVAGEERAGTLGLLLANPTSRTQVLTSKVASMVLLVSAATAAVWVTALTAPVLLDVEIGDTHVGATALHLGVNSLFYGFLAVAIGGWTGSRPLASGVSAAVMVVSYFAVGLLPLVDAAADAVEAFPWYYFDGSDPLINGVAWGHLTVLGAGIVIFAGAGFVGVNRRDLRDRGTGGGVLDRLREHPTTTKLVERLAGTSRVSHLWTKTASEHQGLLVVVSLAMFLIMGVLMGPSYASVEADISALSEDLPDALLAIAGGGDMSTPEGFFTVETFSLMAPIAVMVVTILIGARGLAGEERNRTMGLLLANPIRRSTVILELVAAMVVYAAVVAFATFAGVVIASAISDLGMRIAGIAAASLLVALVGLLFGALALALGAATGRVAVALYGAIGAAMTSHLLNSFLPLSDDLAPWAELTPHHYYLSSDPLVNGMDWGHGAVLAGVTVALVAGAVWSFDRRDLRS